LKEDMKVKRHTINDGSNKTLGELKDLNKYA